MSCKKEKKENDDYYIKAEEWISEMLWKQYQEVKRMASRKFEI